MLAVAVRGKQKRKGLHDRKNCGQASSRSLEHDLKRSAANRIRTTAARAFHADRELLSASKLILDTKNPAYRAVATVRSEAFGYWRTVTLPFPEAGIRLLPQNSLGLFPNTMAGYRERLQEAARELAGQYDTIKSEAQRRLGSLYNASDYPQTLDGLFDLEASCPTIEPPGYLMALHPDVYQAEQARVRERFESAVELAEQALALEAERAWLSAARMSRQPVRPAVRRFRRRISPARPAVAIAEMA